MEADLKYPFFATYDAVSCTSKIVWFNWNVYHQTRNRIRNGKGDIIINPYEAATVSPSDSVHCAHTDVELTLGGRKWGGKSRSYTPSGGRQSKHSPRRRPAEPVCEIDSIDLLAFLFDLKQNVCVDMWMYFTLCKYQLPVALIMFRYNKIQKRFFFSFINFSLLVIYIFINNLQLLIT